DFSNPITAFLKTGIDALTSRTVQLVGDFVPEEHAELALQVLNVMKGESFQRILEEQRNLELARLAGTTAQFFASPQEFLKRVQYEAKVWFKTLCQSHGLEKIARIAAQILLPTAAVIGSVGAVAVVLMGGPISWITALSFSFTGLSLSLTLARKSDQLFNRYLPTRKRVEKELAEEAKLAAQKAISADMIKQRDAFIRELQKNQVLPTIEKVEINLSGDQKSAYDQAKKQILTDLKRQMDAQWQTKDNPIGIDCVKIFTDVGLNQIASQVTALAEKSAYCTLLEQRAIQTTLANEAAETLMQDWLHGRIDQVFTARTIHLSQAPLKEMGTPQDPQALIDRELGRLIPNPIARKEVRDELQQIRFA
ncbi:MAG: hypothetical protein ACHQUC_10605, partial [Chlamydiales bacterium]